MPRVTKTHPIQQFSLLTSPFQSSRWFLDKELSCGLGWIWLQKEHSVIFKCASQKYCYTNPKFQFSNYCQQVLKWIHFLFKEKDSANTEGAEKNLPATTNLSEYCNFLRRQILQQETSVTPRKSGQLDQMTFCQIRMWFTKNICDG